jgi:hypothetical protein
MHWVAAGKGFSFTCNRTTLEVKVGCSPIRISAFSPVTLLRSPPPLPFVSFNEFQAILQPLAEGQRSANGSPAIRYRRGVLLKVNT